MARPNGRFFGRIGLPVVLCLALACLPLLLNLILWLIDRSLALQVSISPGDYPLALALAGFTFVMLTAGWAGLRFVDDRREEFDLTLAKRRGRRGLEHFTCAFFSWGTQLLFVAVAVGALAWVMIDWGRAAGHTFSPGGWISAVWPTALGALLLHWCIPLPFVLDLLLRPKARPYLIPYEPASTHWVGLVARVVGLGGGLIAILAVVVGLINATLVITGRTSEPTEVIFLARSTLPALSVVFIATALWFWVIPSWQLTSIVTHGKRRELDRLRQLIDAESATPRADETRVLALRDAYRQVSSSPDSPFSTQTTAQYLAAFLGVLAGALLPVVFSTFGVSAGP